MTTTLIIPWRGGDPDRERARKYLTKRYKATWPHLRLVWATYDTGEWCKGRAVYPHLREAKNGLVVIADADVWCDGLLEAIEQVRQGTPWAIPHKYVYRLSREGTADYMAGRGALKTWARSEPSRPGMSGGGFVVAERDTLLDIPLDPRFVGWGQEDEAHAIALKRLTGPPWRGKAPLIHLWHPPQPRMNRRWGSSENHRIRQFYMQARSRESMQALLKEVHVALNADQPILHDHHPKRGDNGGRLRERASHSHAG